MNSDQSSNSLFRSTSEIFRREVLNRSSIQQPEHARLKVDKQVKSSVKLTTPMSSKAQINGMPKQFRRASFMSSQMQYQNNTATRKNKSYLHNLIYNNANFLSRV